MKAYLVGQTIIDHGRLSSFYADEGVDIHPSGVSPEPTEELCEVAGRLCYMSFGKGRKNTREFLLNIIAQKHFSVLEHANFTFIFTGVSRSLTHELVRHRHFSFSQLSQRYVDHTTAEFICPPEIESVGLKYDWDRVMSSLRRLYVDITVMLEREEKASGATTYIKALRTIARAVLPNAVETKIMVTGNARAWREFIEKRNTEAADPEIRSLAAEVKKQLHAVAPNLFYWEH